MNSHLRPFDVPRAITLRPDPNRALVATPSSFVGRVVCAESDVGLNGAPVTDSGEAPKAAGATLGDIAVYVFVFGFVGVALGFGVALGLDVVGVLSMSAGVPVFVLLFAALAIASAIVLARWLHRFSPETLYIGERGIERVRDSGGTLNREGVAYEHVVAALRVGVRQVGTTTFLRESLVLVGAEGRVLFTLEGSTREGSPSTTSTRLVKAASDVYQAQRLASVEERLRSGGFATFPVYGGHTPLLAGGGGYAQTDSAILVSGDRVEVRRGAATQNLAISELSRLALMSGYLEIVPKVAAGAPMQFVLNQIGDGDVLIAVLGARGIRVM